MTLTTFVALAVSLRSVARDQSTGCASAMFAPQRIMTSASSMSSYTFAGSSMPKVCMKAATAEAMQWRALGSRLFERKPAFISFDAT